MRPKFEQPFAHAPRVRQSQVWTMLKQKLDQPGVVGKHIDGPRLDVSEDAWVVVLDDVRHEAMLAHALTLCW